MRLGSPEVHRDVVPRPESRAGELDGRGARATAGIARCTGAPDCARFTSGCS